MLEFVRETGAEVWTGANVARLGVDGRQAPHQLGLPRLRRRLVDPRYDKNLLVPFGEFMPLADNLPRSGRFGGPGTSRAARASPVHDGGLARFAFLICYEAIHSGYVRAAVRQEPDLLVNLTFDAWYGDTSEPHTHLMLSAVQAAQYGLPLLRSTTTGISAVVDARDRHRADRRLHARGARPRREKGSDPVILRPHR